MQISSNLPLPLNTTRYAIPNRQRAPNNNDNGPLPETSRQVADTFDPVGRRFRFVMPDNATTRSGQMALREYQTIQNQGGPELVNRIDVRV